MKSGPYKKKLKQKVEDWDDDDWDDEDDDDWDDDEYYLDEDEDD